MDEGGKELVNFPLGWGFFQTEDEITNGWSVSQTQEALKRHREEQEEINNKRQKPQKDQGSDGLDQSEWVEQDVSVCLELREGDNLGKCDLCEEQSVHVLGLEDSNILKIREKVDVSQLCDSHFTNLVQKYSFFQVACADPYQLHKKKMKERLVVVTMDMHRNNHILLPGQKVCRNCVGKVRCQRASEGANPGDLNSEELGFAGGYDRGDGGDGEDEVSEGAKRGDLSGEELGFAGGDNGADGGDEVEIQSQQSSIHQWSQEYQVSKGLDTVNQALSILNISPVKKSQLTNAHGMKKKLDNIRDGIKEQLNFEGIDQTASDAAELLASMKSQFDRAVNRSDKYKILTSLPGNWSEHKVAKEFSCSKTLARDALKLRSVYGQGSDPGLKAGHKIPNEVATKVLEFYYAQDVTKEMPGKKDCILVREGRTRTFKQKRLLLASNLREAYAHFKLDNPDITIGFSTFAAMRPKEVILPGISFQTTPSRALFQDIAFNSLSFPGSSGSHIVCCCVYCQNPTLALQGDFFLVQKEI